jgi:hypothetical protein
MNLCTKKIACPKCGEKRTKDGQDPCIANLPGVINACCGHGVKEGYVMFDNGIVIRGIFERDHFKDHVFNRDLRENGFLGIESQDPKNRLLKQ